MPRPSLSPLPPPSHCLNNHECHPPVTTRLLYLCARLQSRFFLINHDCNPSLLPVPQIFSPAHKKEALRYLHNHQNEDGGFGLHIEGGSTMFGTGLK